MPKPDFHPDELALLAAIHASPRDDTPRLVYADWLDEHGEPDCAEFIRLMCGEPDLVLETRGQPHVSTDCWQLKYEIPDICQRAIELLGKLYGTPRYPETILFDQYARGLPRYQDEMNDGDLRYTGGHPNHPNTPLLRLSLSLRTAQLADWLNHSMMQRVDVLRIWPELPDDAERDEDYTMNSHSDDYWAENIPVLAASPIIDRLCELNPCGLHSTGDLTDRSAQHLALCKELLEPRVHVTYDY